MFKSIDIIFLMFWFLFHLDEELSFYSSRLWFINPFIYTYCLIPLLLLIHCYLWFSILVFLQGNGKPDNKFY